MLSRLRRPKAILNWVLKTKTCLFTFGKYGDLIVANLTVCVHRQITNLVDLVVFKKTV